MDIRVSVVIPTYNRQHYIRQCIESVLSQTLPVHEIIIIDDGSTDNTIHTINDYIKNGKVKYFYQDNTGVSSARNAGFSISSGTHIAFLDSDDTWKNTKNEEQILFLKKNTSIKFVHTDTELIDDKSTTINNTTYRDFSASGFCFYHVMKCCSINISSALFDRCVLNNIGIFDTRLAGSEDYELLMRVAYHYEIGFINKKLSCYRIHSSSTSSNRLEILLQAIKAIDILLSKKILDKKNSNLLHKRKSNFYYRLAKRSFYEFHNKKLTLSFLKNAILINSFDLKNYALLLETITPTQLTKNIRWYKKKITSFFCREQ